MSRKCLDYETVYSNTVMGFAELREERQGCLKNGHKFYFWNTCQKKESLTNVIGISDKPHERSILMAKKHSIEETLTRLGKVTKASLTDNDVQDIQHALNSANNVIVAKAARVAANCGLTTLLPQLIAAFGRCLNNSTKTDKGCFARLAIVEALDALDAPNCYKVY